MNHNYLSLSLSLKIETIIQTILSEARWIQKSNHYKKDKFTLDAALFKYFCDIRKSMVDLMESNNYFDSYKLFSPEIYNGYKLTNNEFRIEDNVKMKIDKLPFHIRNKLYKYCKIILGDAYHVTCDSDSSELCLFMNKLLLPIYYKWMTDDSYIYQDDYNKFMVMIKCTHFHKEYQNFKNNNYATYFAYIQKIIDDNNLDLLEQIEIYLRNLRSSKKYQ
jgi:hypothetical protein